MGKDIKVNSCKQINRPDGVLVMHTKDKKQNKTKNPAVTYKEHMEINN